LFYCFLPSDAVRKVFLSCDPTTDRTLLTALPLIPPNFFL